MVAQWAVEEMSGADFGDKRLNARAARIVSDLGRRPNLSIPAACMGYAEMTAAYRFFDNENVTFDQVLGPHVERTCERVAQQEVVLLVQDTSEIELTRPEQQVVGVGELDRSRRGFLLHEMQAFTPDGTPLGTAWAEILNRTEGLFEGTDSERTQRRKQTPIEEKESYRWLKGLCNAREMAEKVPDTQLIVVGDSESDIYEVLTEPRGERPVDWVIRACQDRALQGLESQSIREKVLSTPVLYKVDLVVRGREAKSSTEDRSRRVSRETRRATVEVRAASVTLRPPYRPDRKLEPVTINVVVVRESTPPEGEPPVEWILLTTLPIDTPEHVRLVVEYYSARWNIEVFFRTLKSGCRVEHRRFEHVDRVTPYLAVCLIVAWRTLFVCRLGRDCPDLDCSVVLEANEWKAVWAAVNGVAPPTHAPTLSEMVRLIAMLGGYVNRPESEPGPQTVWVGIQRMCDLTWAWTIFGPGGKIRAG